MIIFRSVLFFIGFALSTIFVAPLVLINMGRSLSSRYYFIHWWVNFNLWWLRLTCDLDYHVEGLEHIPDTGCVVVSNHQSTWETILINRLFPECAYVLKKELFNLPFFGWALARLDQIPIDRSAGIRALDEVVKMGTGAVADNRKVIIFPEGTRTHPDEKPAFNVGASLLATRSGALVLPIAHNAGRYWPRMGFLKKPGTIRVRIGPVINSQGIKPRQLNKQLEEWIRSAQDEIDQP